MTKMHCKFKIIGSILLFLFIFSSVSQSFLHEINNNSLKGETDKNSEELKLSATYWTTTEVVSTESTDPSRNPTITVDGTGNVHVAWFDLTNYSGSGTDRDIFYKQWNATSSTWTTTEVISTESTLDSEAPTIKVDGTGNIHIAWFDLTNYSGSGTDRDIFYKQWNTTDSTWTTTEVVSTESTLDSEAPTIEVDHVGNIHIAWFDLTNYSGSGTDRDIFYKQWNATSSTWTTTEVISTESTADSYVPMIAVDGDGNAHVAWYDYTNYSGSGTDWDIFYKRWNATSSTWTTTEVVSTESNGDSFSPTIAVDSIGNTHVAWGDTTNYSGAGTEYDIFYKRWNATSSMWTMTEVVSTESTGNSYMKKIAVDGDGNAHVAWDDYTDYDGAGIDRDIFYKQWNATSSTWTTTEVISTESTRDSYFPTIAVDGTGYAHVAWFDDTGYDEAGWDYDIFYKRMELLREIKINSPIQNDLFGSVAPNFNISVIISNLDTMWYTLDGGITNITFSGLTGTIDQTEWNKKGDGPVIIRFYGNDTIGFEVYDDVTVIKSVPIPSIISPENKTYAAPMSGYYPATYGFENDLNGSNPEGWYQVLTYGGSSEILNEYINHFKVVSLFDYNSTDQIDIIHNFTQQISGDIEFYFYTNDSFQRFHICISEDISGLVDGVYLDVVDGKVTYRVGAGIGTWYDITTLSNNTWHHFLIQFDSTLDKFWLTLDGVVYGGAGGFDYRIPTSNLNSIMFRSGTPESNYRIYLDAISFSWDPNYDIGDNLNEGLMLGFENTSTVDWIGYSLDSQTTRTILGNITVSMPEDGVHTIQIFGNDSVGILYQSNVRYFSVDTRSPQITIKSPDQNDFFGASAPSFEITIVEPNLNTVGYTLDDGLINKTFTGLTGTIDQTEWDKKGHGAVTIRFYANDSFGREGSAEVVFDKDLASPTSLVSFIPHSGINEVNISTSFILTADDGLGSGVSVIRYKINNSTWADYTDPFDLSSYEYGYYHISYHAIDLVNNTETVNTRLVLLVKLPSEQIVPGYHMFLLIGLICVVSVVLIKKHNNNNL